MVLSETRGHTAISGRARVHKVGPDPRPNGHLGRLLILMLARDSVKALGTRQTANRCCRRLGQAFSAPRVKGLMLSHPVFIELVSIFPKGQSQIGDLPR